MTYLSLPQQGISWINYITFLKEERSGEHNDSIPGTDRTYTSG